MIQIGTPFNNSLKMILKKFVKYCLAENHCIDNTTAYVKSNIFQTTHFMVKKALFEIKGFPQNQKKLSHSCFFKIDLKILSNEEFKNITPSVFPMPNIIFFLFSDTLPFLNQS